MSLPRPPSTVVCRWPVSTRTLGARRFGVAQGVLDLVSLAPSALLLEAVGPPLDLLTLANEVRAAGVPVLGVLGPLVRYGGEDGVTIDAPSSDAADVAMNELAATVPYLAKLGTKRLIVPLSGTLPGASLLETSLEGLDEAAKKDKVAEFFSRAEGAREAATERLVRRLHRLGAAFPDVELLLLPGPGAAGGVDPVALAWVLEDLSRQGISACLDVGAMLFREARGGPPPGDWFAAASRHLSLVFFADHDGKSRSDLAPGLGVARFSALKDLLPRGIPWCLRPDPYLPAAFIPEGISLLDKELGPPPSVR